MGHRRACSRLGARLRALRAALLLDGLPSGFYEDCWRAKSGVIRFVEVTNAWLIIAVNPALMISHGTRDLLLKMYSPQRLLLVIALGVMQVYLMLWRSKWWDEHRRRLMTPLYLVRCITYGDAWAAFARHRTIHLAAGSPERQFSYAVASATSFPLIMGATSHAVESFKGHLLVHSLITAAFLVYHQPVFVGLFRWAPCFDQAMQLQQRLHETFAGLIFALTGTTAGTATPQWQQQQQQQQQQQLPCPLLQLSLWLHLVGAWLAPTYLMYIYFSSAQSRYMREQAVAVLGNGTGMPALEQEAEPSSSAAAADAGGASCSSGSAHGRSSSSSSGATRRAAGRTSGALAATAVAAAERGRGERGARHGTWAGRHPAAGDLGQPPAPPGAIQPDADVIQWQRLQLRQAMSCNYPAASQQQLQELSQRMLAAVYQPYADGPLALRFTVSATWHACVFGLLLVLLWLAAAVAALVVQQFAVRLGFEWASLLCDTSPTPYVFYADGLA